MFSPMFLLKVLKVCILRNNRVCVCGRWDAVDFNLEIFVTSLMAKKWLLYILYFIWRVGKHIHCQRFVDALDFFRFYSQFYPLATLCLCSGWVRKKHLVSGRKGHVLASNMSFGWDVPTPWYSWKSFQGFPQNIQRFHAYKGSCSLDQWSLAWQLSHIL